MAVGQSGRVGIHAHRGQPTTDPVGAIRTVVEAPTSLAMGQVEEDSFSVEWQLLPGLPGSEPRHSVVPG